MLIGVGSPKKQRHTREGSSRSESCQELQDKRPISKKLRAALVWSIRGQHCEKMVCMRVVPGVTGILEKTNSHFNPTQTSLGTALAR